MILTPAAFLSLALSCAPSLAPETVLAVVRAESGLNPWAIGVNHGGPPVSPPRSREEAIATAEGLAARGANFDVGLAQINNVTLTRLGLSLAEAFDPCRNLAAAASVLGADYQAAARLRPEPQAALRTAFSLYNTGDPGRGFRNGYVARIEAAATANPASATARPELPPPPAWDVFAHARAGFVLTPASEGTAP
jgi:type IV secretion system protein VirB1